MLLSICFCRFVSTSKIAVVNGGGVSFCKFVLNCRPKHCGQFSVRPAISGPSSDFGFWYTKTLGCRARFSANCHSAAAQISVAKKLCRWEGGTFCQRCAVVQLEGWSSGCTKRRSGASPDYWCKSACLAAPSHPDHQLDSDLLKTPNPTVFRIYGLGLGLFRILGLGLLRI